ncbi:MAG: hypothetical protein JXA93_23490 [Anaerolineae bacterium]|nr:hypothetical protein [Anaerolineae bacterium]
MSGRVQWITYKNEGLPGFKMAVVQALTFFRSDLYVADGHQAALDWLLAQDIED